MREQDNELRLEGIVHAFHYDPNELGKEFLGAEIDCGNGKTWVITYNEQSPYHAFAGRQVVVSGEPYEPKGQYLLGRAHFSVSTMQLSEVTPAAEFVEVGEQQDLCGRFERGTSEIGDSRLSFVTEEGVAFLVANDPAGATIGSRVEVCAYPMQPSPLGRRPLGRYLWIICPHSADDIWEWRKRHLRVAAEPDA